jgi:hypothetical protein
MKTAIYPQNIIALTLISLLWQIGNSFAEEIYTSFNYVLGTQTFQPKYQFTEETRLVETAMQIEEMGSNILKILIDSDYSDHYKLPQNTEVNSFTSLLEKEPSYRKVLRMPFDYYFFWAHCSPVEDGRWKSRYDWTKGYSESQRFDEYQQIYDLTCYLLTRFNNSGKTFFLGHWEGDWAIMGEPYSRDRDIPQKAFDGMIERMNTRQLAVDNAKRDTPHKNVDVFHYMETVLVEDAIQKGKKTLTNSVLPYVDVDFVSFSCYSSLGNFWEDNVPMEKRKETMKTSLLSALDFIEKHMPPTGKKYPWDKRVFIGEYGFRRFHRGSQKISVTEQQQAEFTRTAAAAALSWGCPFVLYWQMYDNESEEGGANPSGLALIDKDNQKQPAYYVHQLYYERARDFLKRYNNNFDRNPTQAEFRAEAVKWLEETNN